MHIAIQALLINLAAVVHAEKGNGTVEVDELKKLSIHEMRNSSRLLRKTKRKEAIPLSFQAIVAEEVSNGSDSNGGTVVWKGLHYGQELTGKGGKGSKGKSNKSQKYVKCDESRSSKGGKGKGSRSGDIPTQLPTCSPSPTTTMEPQPSSGPSVSPIVMTTSPSPTISPSPTKSPTTMPSETSSSVPSGFPSIVFDLQVCESYSRQWILDLTGSCDAFFDNCSCADAKKLIDDDKIQCGGESQCPPKCEVCRFCLIDVLDCYDEETPTIKPSSPPFATPTEVDKSSEPPTSTPTSQPSWQPTKVPTKTPTKTPSVVPTSQPSWQPTKVPAKTPSVSPSVVPTSKHSSEPSTEPTTLFDLQVCGTYALQWIMDLDKTCENFPDSSNSCVCIDAQARIDSGEIECNGNADCPEGCDVCEVCLYSIIGCPFINNPPPSSPPSKEASDEPSATPSKKASDEPSATPSVGPTPVTSLVVSQVPSASPSLTPSISLFDLSDCTSYNQQWRFNLIVDGECTLAMALVKEGKITCDSECPSGIPCVMCNICLNTILDCPDPPSPSPTVMFDLSDCDSYADRWLHELVDTGTCGEANFRAAAGEIGCREEECPAGCDICEVCLTNIPCPDTPSPSSKPTSLDPTISPKPSSTLTPAPTASFSLDDCSSYTKIWLLDLSTTCGQLSEFEDVSGVPSTNSCQAIDAENKISMGKITCGVDVCPADCSICTFCLYDVLGCMPAQAQARTRRKNRSL